MAASVIALPALITSVISAATLTSKLLQSDFCHEARYNDVDLVDYIDRWHKIADDSLPDYSVAYQRNQGEQTASRIGV
jgi:hypothetical protein